MCQQIAFPTLSAWDQHGMRFRYSWSLFAWGREHCCPHSSLVGVVGDTQKRTKKEEEHKRGYAALGRGHLWGKNRKGEDATGGPTCHGLVKKIVTGAQPTPSSSVRVKCQMPILWRVMLLFSRDLATLSPLL